MLEFPKHKCGLYLEHNPHLDVYKTVEQYLEDTFDPDSIIWINEEEKELAIKNNQFWCLQWYPDTPNGFYEVYAYDLLQLLAYCRDENNFK